MRAMNAMILRDVNRFEKAEVPVPVIEQPDEVLIRVLVCSICGTDVRVAAEPDSASYGDMRGRILGHEIVGEVAGVGSAVTAVAPGDRVVVNPNSWCGICPSCRAGRPNHCEKMELMGLTVPGGFAEYVKTHERMVFRISKDLPLYEAAFAEPLSCVMNGFSRLSIRPGSTFLEIGCGPIGLLFAQLARLSGARVLCTELKEPRIAIVKKLGFDLVSPSETDPAAALRARWGTRADTVVDTAGGQLGTAIAAAECCGTILCFASPRTAKPVDLGPIQSKELTIMGSFIIHDSIPKAIAVLEQGLLDLQPEITHILPLEKLEDGLALMRSGEGMKIILQIA